MARLPQPGGDDGSWGAILNEFLKQTHNDDGTLKPISQSQIVNLTADLAAKASTADLAAKANTADLAAVATTGSYSDLSNTPARTLVLGPADPVPAGTPAGTIIFRTL
jgi:hypothetical protein